VVSFNFNTKAAQARRKNMNAYGKRHYQVDYDRGCELRELPTGEQIHRYPDEQPSLWRNARGEVLPQQPQD
jgi:hypothetical protein